MKYDKALKRAQPQWMEDGSGLRGNAPVDFSLTRHDPGDGKVAVESASLIRDVPATILGSAGEPFSSGMDAGYPWIGQYYDSTNAAYAAWLGTGSASFVTGGAAALEGLQIWVDSPGTTMSLIVGDASPSNDLLEFYGDGSAKLSLNSWADYPEIDLVDQDGNTASLEAQSLEFDDSLGDPKITLGFSSEIGEDGDYGLLIGDTQLSDGNLTISSNGGDNQSILTPGDLDLGTDASITCHDVGADSATIVFEPTQIQDCNGKTLWILADQAGWQSAT